MTIPELLDTLSTLTTQIYVRASTGRKKKTMPMNVVLVFLVITEHNKIGKEITVADLTTLLGQSRTAVLDGVYRLIDAKLIVQNPPVPPTRNRALELTADGVDLVITSLRESTRTNPVFPKLT